MHVNQRTFLPQGIPENESQETEPPPSPQLRATEILAPHSLDCSQADCRCSDFLVFAPNLQTDPWPSHTENPEVILDDCTQIMGPVAILIF